jgi:hypothetical protein
MCRFAESDPPSIQVAGYKHCQKKVTYSKVVGERCPGRNGALRRSSRAVHGVCPLLVYAMPVNAAGFIAQEVVHMDNDPISDSCTNGWTGELSIDTDHWSDQTSIRICINPGNPPIIFQHRRIHASTGQHGEKEVKESMERHCVYQVEGLNEGREWEMWEM